jgi:hypothetical protein
MRYPFSRRRRWHAPAPVGPMREWAPLTGSEIVRWLLLRNQLRAMIAQDIDRRTGESE